MLFWISLGIANYFLYKEFTKEEPVKYHTFQIGDKVRCTVKGLIEQGDDWICTVDAVMADMIGLKEDNLIMHNPEYFELVIEAPVWEYWRIRKS